VIQTVVSHYRVLHLLGEGGMGVVYSAEDLRLGREVAIKFLRPEGGHEQWLVRFEREARLASSLQHPHICTIHELGEHEGRPFIVMELLEGRTIKQLLEDGPLPVDRVLDYAVQVATALDAAHARGIIHRDIKPANLFVTHGDRLKVLDFGLAKLAGGRGGLADVSTPGVQTGSTAGTQVVPPVPDVTTTGITVGTAAYMSPEQATGATVDARTDLFSFGSVLYEMATGRRAFPGDSTPLVLQRLLQGDVIPAHAVNPAVPDRLEAIIDRALQVNPNRRYQSASDVLADLRGLAKYLSPDTSGTAAAVTAVSGPSTARPAGRWRRWSVAGVVGAMALAAIAWWAFMSGRPAPLSVRDRLLVAGFANTTGDAVFDETLATALKVQLGQSPFLDIVADDRIGETLRLMNRSADEALTHESAREVCQRLGVKAMLEGSVGRLGNNYVVTLTATDCESGAALDREQGEATSRESVLGVLGSLSSSMRTSLGESLPSIKRFDVRIEQATTGSLEALKAYTMGVAERRRGRELESIAFFNQAIELDPEFAAAYTTLSTVYGSLGEWQRSEEYARLAYARVKRVSERERLFITYQYHDRVTGNQEQAAETLEVWKLSYPRDSRPPNALALIQNRLGRYERGVAEAQEALRRSPGHPFPMSNLGIAHRGLGQYAEARKVAEEAVALGVATTPTRRLLYQLGVLMGDGSEAAQLAWATGRPREFDLVSAQAQVAAYGGRLREASQLYTEAADKAKARGVTSIATSYWGHLAWTTALYTDPKDAVASVRELVARTPADADSPGTAPRVRTAAALGLAGLAADAREVAARAQQRYPDGTFVRTVLVPCAYAAIALQGGRADQAIRALEPALPAERGIVAALVPIYLRAMAHLSRRDAEQARRGFQDILDHRGADPFAPVVPLAHLGLARAWQLEGRTEDARRHYEELFRIWAKADDDLPILKRARAEYAATAQP
jgi:tetratricopeptide (TPR) repeat protein/predicted Ser/Thr protein kinase